MKKTVKTICLCCLFLLNLSPRIEQGRLHLTTISLSAQNYGGEDDFFICDEMIVNIPCEDDEVLCMTPCPVCQESMSCEELETHRMMFHYECMDMCFLCHTEMPCNEMMYHQCDGNWNGGGSGNGSGGGSGGGYGGGYGNPGNSGGSNPGNSPPVYIPCEGVKNGKTVRNPLMLMELAPSNGWNIRGATFGFTRNGGARRHDGIDLQAYPGTPVYATYTGVVQKAVKENYYKNFNDENYNGTQDRDAAGKRVTIVCNVNGETIATCFFHLSRVDVNVGDTIIAGTQIGLSGRTGNAADPLSPSHLHYAIRKNGAYIDPYPYLAANYANPDNSNIPQTIAMTTPCD